MMLRDKAKKRRLAFTCFCTIWCLLLAVGCSKEASTKQSSSSEPAIVKQYSNGPMSVRFSINETNLTTAGRVQLVLEVQVPENVDVILPDLPNVVKPFSLSSVDREPPKIVKNHKLQHRWTFFLHPASPGEVVLNPLEITANAVLVKTDPIVFSINSILPEDTDDLEIRDIAEPVKLLPEQELLERYKRIGIGVLIAIFAALLLRLFIKLFRTKNQLAPHQLAMRAIDRLLKADSLEAPELIHELNHILRAYIEAQFNLSVLRKTTGEIRKMRDDETKDLWDENTQQQLMDFLAESETARFAHIVPDGFIESKTDFVRSFIKQTKNIKQEGKPCD